MAFAINHIHLKSHDPGKTAEWWGQAFNFEVVRDFVRDSGDRFIACRSENGITVNISGAKDGEPLGPGDAGVHEGLEHFGLDSENLEADIERLTAVGATLLEGPLEAGPGIRICFIQAPDDVRIELIERTASSQAGGRER
ncbi:MAG: VOC family protein [Dehalococcoidia bacterium]|nr:VOC family protein [Dehalococcoidia bacterium]